MSATNMPDEPYYTSEQIPIPPQLPDVLLQFSKAAIRTQPTDVLAWSAAYVSFIKDLFTSLFLINIDIFEH
jgi:hypothetical protein